MSKKKNTQTKQKNYVRILSLILAIIMLAGAATVIFSLIGSIGQDPHAGHDHAAVEYVETV